jgi:type I restriction enzyme S subunit
MVSWATKTLGELVEMSCDKISVSKLTVDNYVSTENMLPDTGGIEVATKLPTSGNVNAFSPGDVLFSNIRTYFKKVWLAERHGGASTDVIVFRPRDEQQLISSYLYYALSSDTFIDSTVAASKGAKMPRGDKEAMRRYLMTLPPLPVQQHIAGILSAYDELIENSQRRIKLLEAMARALYRDWFVHFHYPGHEAVPLVDSPLGSIPQGWVVKSVAECVHINPRVIVPRDGEKPFVPMGCLSNDSMLISGIEFREGNSGAKFQNGDTLFARITPCLENGKTGFVQFLPDDTAVAFGSTEFIVLRSRMLTPEFVYCLARSEEFRGVAIKSMSGATGRQRVQEQCFDDFQIALPPRELLDQYSAIVAPGFRLIYKLQLQTENLRRTRDLLLPRLLSGQVSLKRESKQRHRHERQM